MVDNDTILRFVSVPLISIDDHRNSKSRTRQSLEHCQVGTLPSSLPSNASFCCRRPARCSYTASFISRLSLPKETQFSIVSTVGRWSEKRSISSCLFPTKTSLRLDCLLHQLQLAHGSNLNCGSSNIPAGQIPWNRRRSRDTEFMNYRNEASTPFTRL